MTGAAEPWDPEDTAGYMAASITKAAHECAWPDDIAGNAARLLIQDLGEFAETMMACGKAGYWSPARALERMFLERVEVLMGAMMDSRVAKRYLDTVVAEPKDTSPLKPSKRARPEDALESYFKALSMSPEDEQASRESLLTLKGVASDWFVHPTAMGPFLSKWVREGDSDGADEWANLVQVLCYGCVNVIAAANRLHLTPPIEILRALQAGAMLLTQLGSKVGATMLELHREIVERAPTVPHSDMQDDPG